MSDERPVVAVWRQHWLPRSETFVRDHVANLQRYHPLAIGVSKLPDGLPITPDRAPLPASGPLRRLEGISRRTGWLGLFDDLLVRTRPALLHAHFGTDAVRALPIVKRHRLPMAVTFHGYDVQSAPQRIAAPLYRDRLAELFGTADLLLPVSDFLARQLVELGAPAEKVHTHYLGIPTHRAVEAAQDEREGIVLVGRFVPAKGLDRLVDVLLALPQELRCVPVTLVGGGELEPDLRAAAAAHPELDIRFAGWRTPDEVARLMARAEVFCMLSQPTPDGVAESFGLVALEAALAATPVVSFACGGLPEAVDDGRTGLVVPVGDIDGFASALAGLLRDRGRARAMGEAGRARVLADFDVRRQTALLESRYDSVRR